MHHAGWTTALCLTRTQLSQHRLRRIPAMNDHRQTKLNGQIKLRTQYRKLFVQILLPEQIESKLTNGDHALILQG